MTILAALALFVAPILSAQAPPAPESTTLSQIAFAAEDADQKCVIVLGHVFCF